MVSASTKMHDMMFKDVNIHYRIATAFHNRAQLSISSLHTVNCGHWQCHSYVPAVTPLPCWHSDDIEVLGLCKLDKRDREALKANVLECIQVGCNLDGQQQTEPDDWMSSEHRNWTYSIFLTVLSRWQCWGIWRSSSISHLLMVTSVICYTPALFSYVEISLCHSFPTQTAIQFVNSFVICRIDYCNIAYYLESLDTSVQSHLNVAAPLIYGHTRYDHVTDFLKDRLHWRRLPEMINFKCCHPVD